MFRAASELSVTFPSGTRPSPGHHPLHKMTVDDRFKATAPALILVSVLWGANFSAMKASLEDLDPFAFNALRFPLASLTLGVFLKMRGRRLLPPSRRAWIRSIWLGLIGHLGYQLFFLSGVDLTLAGNASILIATTPVWVVLLGAAFGRERFSIMLLVGAAISLSGAAILVAGSRGAEDGGSLVGDLLVLAAALVWSLYTVFCRRLIKRYGALEVSAWTIWPGTVALLLFGLPSLLRTDFTAVSATSWFGVGYAGVLGVAVAYFIWYEAIRRIGQSRTALFANLVPVSALLIAWAWLGEVPGIVQIAGAAVIFLGVGFAARAPRTRAGDRARRREEVRRRTGDIG